MIAEDHVLACILHCRETATFHLTFEDIATNEALDIAHLTPDNPAIARRLCGKYLAQPFLRGQVCRKRCHPTMLHNLG